MKTKLNKEQVAKIAGLSDDERADIAGLFSDLEEREREISALRTKAEDSDKVVARNRELEDLTKKRDAELATLNGKLSDLMGQRTDVRSFGFSLSESLSIFAPFFGDETDTEN